MFLVDVSDGNFNGDPDADNSPRIDIQTQQGLVSDVCIKRKIRDAVEQMCGQEEGYRIFINADGVPLNALLREAETAVHTRVEEQVLELVPVTSDSKTGKKKRNNDGLSAEQRRAQADDRRKYLCQHFYDIRCFGGVLSTGDYSAGQVHGPIQITWARSIDPIMPMDMSITRVAITKEGEDRKTTSTMGGKWVVPYGLYRGYGYFNPAYAKESGFSAEDLSLFWDAFVHLWENDHSAARGRLGLHGLYIFSHDTARGNAADHELFERIQVYKREEVPYPRRISDYEVQIHGDNLPTGVTLTRLTR
jgi:CRISPR-associated protein Csd2